jgi:hypothetical protein
VVRGVGQIFAGLTVLGGVAVWSAQGVISASPPSCGRPEDAPGFASQARPGSVPDLVCLDLPRAQDRTQAAGFARIRVSDRGGIGRKAGEDRGWFVVAQAPPAGTRPGSNSEIVLEVRRYDDRSPRTDRTWNVAPKR